MSDNKTVTAGILLIGDELLSGRTQDINLAEIAKSLGPLGVQVGEARILSDSAHIIRESVKAFSDCFDMSSRQAVSVQPMMILRPIV